MIALPVGHEDRGVYEPLHAVGEAGFGATAQFAVRAHRAGLPAGVVQLVDLIIIIQFIRTQ